MRSIVAPLALASCLVAGCGDSSSTVSYTTEEPVPAWIESGSAAGAEATATPTLAPTQTPTPEETASPTETPSESGSGGEEVDNGELSVVGTEYAFDPDTITAKAGEVKVTLDNQGSLPHEIVFLEEDAEPSSLEVGPDGTVDEASAVGEVAEVDGGQSQAATIDFKPGRYVLVCNVPGHYTAGMFGSMEVR